MNILQAYELAKAGKTVISQCGLELVAEDFTDMKTISSVMVFGHWYVKREPRVRWMNEYSNGFGEQSFISKDSADKNACKDRIACVKFVEVIDEA